MEPQAIDSIASEEPAADRGEITGRRRELRILPRSFWEAADITHSSDRAITTLFCLSRYGLTCGFSQAAIRRGKSPFRNPAATPADFSLLRKPGIQLYEHVGFLVLLCDKGRWSSCDLGGPIRPELIEEQVYYGVENAPSRRFDGSDAGVLEFRAATHQRGDQQAKA